MPFTTPAAKFSPKILAQNRAARLYRSSPVRKARHFQYTNNHASPMVSSIGVETQAAAREAAGILKRLGEDAPDGGTPLRVLRKLDVRKRREEELNKSPPVTPDAIKISTCDFRKLRVEPGSVDSCLSDPPWSNTEKDFLDSLAAKIEKVCPGQNCSKTSHSAMNR